MDTPDITQPSGIPITDDVVHSKVDLFVLPQAEYSVENLYTTWIGPSSAITDTTKVIDFHIAGTDEFVSLKECLLDMIITIKSHDGTNLPDDSVSSHTGYIQSPLVSLWKNVEIKVC